jgi:hypothetical protein
MKPKTNSVIAACIALMLAMYPASALATPPKKTSSALGGDPTALQWNLFGPTSLISGDGLKLKTSFQVLCDDNNSANQSFVTASQSGSDLADAGGCTAGMYIFILQIPSGPDNLEVTFKNLSNFTFNDDPRANYTVGVVECDTSLFNTGILCTNDGATGAPAIPDITFKQSGSSGVTFMIPSIPSYPAVTGCVGNTNIPNNPAPQCHQGQGLTLFVETNAAQAGVNVPISFPTIKLKK